MSLHDKLVREAAKAREAGTEDPARIDGYGNRVVNMRGEGRPASYLREADEAAARANKGCPGCNAS